MDIYLDNASTAPLSNSTREYLISILNVWGNPSSAHSQGETAKKLIAKARLSVAKFINANSKDIYFTCGGSASNTLAIKGYRLKNPCSIFYSPIAHKSILKCLENCRNRQSLKVDRTGIISLQDLEEKLNACIAKPFIVIDHANSEIGSIQNIAEVIKLVHLHQGIVYLDCTGSISSIPLDVRRSDVDMCGFSAHKLGGLKGCGVLYKKKSIKLEPLIYGSQESGLVGGTENVLGIASLSKVVENYNYSSTSSSGRDFVHDYILKNIPDSYLVGTPIDSGNRLPHNLYMCFKGVEGEALMILLDMNGIQTSTGSACTSGDLTPSPTLSAIGMNQQDIHCCIRFSFSGYETSEQLSYACNTLKRCVAHLRGINTP